MQSSAAHSSIKNSYPLQTFPAFGKALGTASSKSLGGASKNPSLSRWYESNIQYWRDVQAGKIQVSQQEYQELGQWFGYAEQQLGIGSSSWGNDQGSTPGVSDPNAGSQGPVGNTNITDPANSTFTADGSTPVIDVWVDGTVNIPAPCTATAETTMDNRFNPPEKVTKIVVTNNSAKDVHGNPKPTQTVIFVHDGSKITANSTKRGDGTSRFTDHTGKVTVGEFSADGTSGTDSSMKGTLNHATGELEYVADAGETIDFHPQALAKDGKPRTHRIWGDINIVPPGGYHAKVQVTKDPKTGKVTETTITIMDRDGKPTDVYKVEKDYNAQLNFKPGYVQYGDQAEGDPKPDGFGNITVPDSGDSKDPGSAGPVNTGKGATADAKVQKFIDSFTNPKVSFDDIKKAGLVDEIAYGKDKPSGALLKFILDHDTDLQNLKSTHNSSGMVQRMKTFLEGLGYKISTGIPEGYHKVGDAVQSMAIVINGIPYALVEQGLGSSDPLNLNPISRDPAE